MKRLFVLLLVLAMVVPMVLTPVAKAEDDFTVQPFYGLNWGVSKIDETKFKYLDELLETRITYMGDAAVFSYGGAQMIYGIYTDDDVTNMAKTMKKTMDKRPQGMRYWTLYGVMQFMKIHAENALFMDGAITQLKQMYTDILKKYKEIGGLLDGVVLDVEYEGLHYHYLTTNNQDKQTNNAVVNPKLYWDIVKDPRYATEIRPLLVERGFKFYPNTDSELISEIYCIKESTGSAYKTSRSVWNTVMRIHLNQYANKWCYEPLKEIYPEASLSDYGSTDSYGWSKGVSVTDAGMVISGGGNTIKVGTSSCESFYFGSPSSTTFREYTKEPGQVDAMREFTAFHTALYYFNRARRMYEANDMKQISPWLVDHAYNGTKSIGAMKNSHYYTELPYHLGMYDPEPFLLWFYHDSSRYTGTLYEDYLWVVEDQMAELTRVAGFSDRKPIPYTENWNEEFMLSGMYSGGRNIWRFTPNDFYGTKEDYLVEDAKDPTFYMKGQTVTFPGGKIIEDGPVRDCGSFGFWIETPKDVVPIIQNDETRFVDFPAYQEDYESYEAGSKLTTSTLQYPGTWAITAKGSDLLIEADGTNKVLTITGNSAIKSTLMPQNITAGDSYAKQQNWEVKVTIPAGMTADEALTLLNYEAAIVQDENAEDELEDGGFKISGGKVYYFDKEQYKELSLDVSKGGTYTFRRIVNFKDDVCDYIILDSTGKEVASAKGVAILDFTGKVTGIGITCKDVKNRVKLDNFKIRADSAFADFMVYEAHSGLMVEKTKVQDCSAGYRLSWLNVNETVKTAKIMADITEDGKTTSTLIKEITMEPGCDGVVTGKVEIAEGQTIKLYLKTDVALVGDGEEEEEPTEPEVPEDTKPDAPEDTTPTQAPTTKPTATKAPTVETFPEIIGSRVSRPTEAPEEIPTEPEATEAPEEYPTEPEETDPPVWIPILPEDPTEATDAPEATEAPEATDAPEETEAPDATEAPEVTDEPTEPSAAPTKPSTPAETEESKATKETKPKKDDEDEEEDADEGPNVILIVAIAAGVVLIGGGAAAYFLVIRKKLAAKKKQA